MNEVRDLVPVENKSTIAYNQGSKCPSLPGLTHWVNPGLPGLGFKPYFGKVGNTGESNILNVQNCANL